MDINKICDGYFDCPDGADEKGCAGNSEGILEPSSLPNIFIRPISIFTGCPENMFVCDTENHLATVCFDISNRCDNIHHCRDGKDEKNCEILTDSIDSKVKNIQHTSSIQSYKWSCLVYVFIFLIISMNIGNI